MKKWKSLVAFATEFGEPVVSGIAAMEAQKGIEVYSALREVRGLWTRDAREELSRFIAVGPRASDVESKIRELALDQWTRWHWCPENPNIHPELCMFSSLPSFALHW